MRNRSSPPAKRHPRTPGFNPARLDPTRMAGERRAFGALLGREFGELEADLRKLIVDEDCFGLKARPSLTYPSLNTRWSYIPDDAKVRGFDEWLVKRLSQPGGFNDPSLWTNFVLNGYVKGLGRSFTDATWEPPPLPEIVPTTNARKPAKPKPAPKVSPKKDEFVGARLNNPRARDKARTFSQRINAEVANVSQRMRTKINRALNDGLVQGLTPKQIAKKMVEVTNIEKGRAMTIARTELSRAHAEGQLDALEELGVETVGAAVEYSNSGKPCPLCRPMIGIVLKVSEARGLIPRHVNCLCAWVPANVGESSKGQKRTKRQIETAFKKSGLTDPPAIAPKRPKGIV